MEYLTFEDMFGTDYRPPPVGDIGDFSSLADTYASQYGISPDLIKSQINVESGQDPNIISDAGAAGIMQILPSTAEGIAAELGEEYSYEKLFDPNTNIRWGTYHMKTLLDKFGGDEQKAHAAYLGGEGTVKRTLAAGKPLSSIVDPYTGMNAEEYSAAITGGKVPEQKLEFATFDEVWGKPAAEAPQKIETVQESPAEKFLPQLEAPPAETTGVSPEFAETEEELGKRDILGNIAEAFKRGDVQSTLDYMAYEAQIGKRDWKEVEKLRKGFAQKNRKDPVEARNWLTKSIVSVSGMLPAMIKGIMKGQEAGAAGALGGGIAGLFAPPGVQPVTVPAAAAAGYAIGTKVGATEYWRKISAGSMYADLREKGIKEKTSNVIANITSVPYSLIEMAQLSKLAPGSDKILKGIVTKNIVKKVGSLVARRGVDILEESAQEGIQGSIDQTAQEIGQYVEGQLGKKDLPQSAKNVLGAFWTDFKGSLGAMTLMMTPKGVSGAIDIMGDVSQRSEAGAVPKGFEEAGGKVVHEGAGEAITEAVKKSVAEESPEEKALRIEKAKAIEAGEKAPPIVKGEEPLPVRFERPKLTEEQIRELEAKEKAKPPKVEPAAEKILPKKEPVTKEFSKMGEEEIKKELKTLESEEKAAIRSYGEKQDIELEETEFASRLRQEAFSEKRTVIRKGKVVETTGLEKGLSKKDWAALTGDSTAPRSAEVNKKLQGIADAWNTARDEGPGATALDVPPESLLQSNDNWSPDDVANVLSRGMNKKDFADFKKQRELDIEKIGEEGEIAFEELARRREAIEGRIKEINKLPKAEPAAKKIVPAKEAPPIKTLVAKDGLRERIKETPEKGTNLGDVLRNLLSSETGAIQLPDIKANIFAREAQQKGVVYPETIKDKFIRKAQDKFNRLKNIQQTLTPEISEEVDTYLKQEIMHGRVENQLDNFIDQELKPFERDLAGFKIDMKNFEEYAYAKHAPERNAQVEKINPEFREKGIAGSGMSNEEADAIIQAAKDSGKEKAYERLTKKINEINRETANILLEGGLITQQQHDAWMQYKNYVPLRGINEKDVTRPRAGRGFDIRGLESKRALGRKSKASNILSHSILQRNEAVVRAEKNRVGQAFLKYVEQNPNEDLWEVDKVEYKPRFDKSKGEVVYSPPPKFVLADNVMSVKIDGKETHITIKDPALAKAMVNLGADKSNKVLQTFGSFNRYLSIVNTALVPEFVISNFARDIQTMAINISAEKSFKLAGQIAKDTPKAIKGVYQAERGGKATEWSGYYKEFKEAGGKVGFFGLKNIDQIQKNVANEVFLMKGGKKAQAVRMYKVVGKYIMTVNEAVENGTRLSTYVHMRKAGYSKERAASIAKNVTVNFNKKGELGTTLNSLYIFANASVQGTARLFKALKTPRGKKIAASIAVGSFAMAQLGRFSGGKDDDDVDYYDKIPNWVKENNLIIMRPGTRGKYIKIPVPYGYNVFHAVGQAVDKAIHNPGKKGVLEAASLVAGAAGNAFNPLGSASTLLQNVTPSAGRWFADLSLNKNFFGAPIVREEKYGVPKAKSELFFKSTSEQSKKIARALNRLTGGSEFERGLVDISPDVMDYVTEYLTGGAGKTLNQIVSIGYKMGQSGVTKKPLQIPLRRIPIARRVLGEVEEYEDVGTFYKNVDEIRKVKAQLDYYNEFAPKKSGEYIKKNKGLLQYTRKRSRTIIDKEGNVRTVKRTRLGEMEKKLRNLRRQREEAHKKGKEKVADKIDTIINRTLKIYNKEINKLKEKK